MLTKLSGCRPIYLIEIVNYKQKNVNTTGAANKAKAVYSRLVCESSLTIIIHKLKF